MPHRRDPAPRRAARGGRRAAPSGAPPPPHRPPRAAALLALLLALSGLPARGACASTPPGAARLAGPVGRTAAPGRATPPAHGQPHATTRNRPAAGRGGDRDALRAAVAAALAGQPPLPRAPPPLPPAATAAAGLVDGLPAADALAASPLGWGEAAGGVATALADAAGEAKAALTDALAATGLTPAVAAALAAPLHSRLDRALGALGAVRSAYERTLSQRLGAFLDDTTRLRCARLGAAWALLQLCCCVAGLLRRRAGPRLRGLRNLQHALGSALPLGAAEGSTSSARRRPRLPTPHPHPTRYELLNGEAFIDELRALRGAECEAASFTPPEERGATIKGGRGWPKHKGASASPQMCLLLCRPHASAQRAGPQPLPSPAFPHSPPTRRRRDAHAVGGDLPAAPNQAHDDLGLPPGVLCAVHPAGDQGAPLHEPPRRTRVGDDHGRDAGRDGRARAGRTAAPAVAHTAHLHSPLQLPTPPLNHPHPHCRHAYPPPSRRRPTPRSARPPASLASSRRLPSHCWTRPRC
jgi:hypothetical protein